jgi:Flp pilus assembly pilin Flp
MLRKLLRKIRRDQRGQGMTEYIIIVALIAIAAIGVVTLFGDNIRALFAGASDALAGEQKVQVQSETSKAHHTQTTTLKHFGKNLKGSSR